MIGVTVRSESVWRRVFTWDVMSVATVALEQGKGKR